MQIATTTGKKTFRSSVGQLESGLFSTVLIENTTDFQKFLKTPDSGNKKISGYYFVPLDPEYFVNEVHIIEYRIK